MNVKDGNGRLLGIKRSFSKLDKDSGKAKS
jgi:hypothetical protein